MILIYLSSLWLLGTYVGTLLNLPPLFFLFGLVPLLALLVTRRYRKMLFLAALGIVLFVGAAVYTYSSLYSVDDDNIRFYNDTGALELKGVVSTMPDVRDMSTRLTLDAQEIKLEEDWQPVTGKVLVTVPRYPEFQYGDLVSITGELQTPLTYDDFDYRGYLEHKGIYAVVYYPKIEFLSSGHGVAPLAWIYNLRATLSEKLAEILPEPQASLAQGILLGMRGNIPADLNENFTRSGAAHLLAISGQNLAIMAGILLAIGLWIFGRKRYLYVWMALVVIWFYTVITGMDPPVVRGAIMASVFLFAEVLGRQRSGFAALMFTAAVMVAVNPYILGDVSFQLSFLAMVGLILVYPIFKDLTTRLITSRLGNEGFFSSTITLMIDSFSVTLASIIAVWPVIAYYFGIFSFAGPLATFLITPVFPVIVILGTLAALFGLASIAVAQFFGWLVWPFLTYMIAVVNGLGSPSFASVEIQSFNPYIILVYYIVLVLLIWLHSRRSKVRNLFAGASGVMRAGVSIAGGFRDKLKWAVIPLFIAAILVAYTAATLPDDKLRVSFLDVGQGDAILIQKGNTRILIDGGPSPRDISLELSNRMPYWDRSIDIAVLTHPHQDHLAGLLEVLRRYDVGQVLYPATTSETPLYKEWVRFIGEAGVEGKVAISGQCIDLGDGVSLEVLWPSLKPITGSESDMDNNSVVVLLKSGDISFLLTGDARSEAEWELIRARANIQGTVIKVGHHGSSTSTIPQFLAVANPQLAVISVGASNSYNLPDEDVILGLEEWVGKSNVYRTDLHSTITFVTDGTRLWLETDN